MPDSIVEQADALADAFEFLEDWEARYRFIIDMGRKLEPLTPEEKTEANRVHGCQSTVYMVHEAAGESQAPPTTPDLSETPGSSTGVTPREPAIRFRAESDAAIVNGLIAILRKLFSGQRAADILRFDVEAFFRRVGLSEHLSPTRRNGLFEMVRRIRSYAAQELASR